MRQIADNFAQNHTQRKAALRCSYDYLMSHARLSQDKAIRHTVPAVPTLRPCGQCVMFSCSHMLHSIFAAALEKRAWLSCGFHKTNVWVANYYVSCTNTLRALQQSCGSLACLAAVLRPPEIAQTSQGK